LLAAVEVVEVVEVARLVNAVRLRHFWSVI
jgi:hypothetical protein